MAVFQLVETLLQQMRNPKIWVMRHKYECDLSFLIKSLIISGAQLWQFLTTDPNGASGCTGQAYLPTVCSSSQAGKTSIVEYRVSAAFTAEVGPLLYIES